MTIRHMRIFKTVCACDCNTTKAAEVLNMTQPAVSLAIKELENYYGTILFDRIGKRLRITESGKEFLEYAIHISAIFDEMEKKMKNWDTQGILKIGASITIGSQFLPSYEKAFNARYGGTEIHVVIEPSEKLEQRLLTNDIDFALIEGIAHSSALVARTYMEDHLVTICPVHGILEGKETITIDEFKAQNFLIREKGSGTRDTFDRVTEEAGFVVTPSWEAMSTTALVNAVIAGLGIAVLPYRMVQHPVKSGLVRVLHTEGLSFQRSFNIIHHRQKHLSSAAKAFIDLCCNYEFDYPLPSYNGLN